MERSRWWDLKLGAIEKASRCAVSLQSALGLIIQDTPNDNIFIKFKVSRAYLLSLVVESTWRQAATNKNLNHLSRKSTGPGCPGY